MLQSKKNDLLAGILISILLTLFVNFSLLMRIYERASKGGTDPFGAAATSYYLYFSLGWFFLFALMLFFLDVYLYKVGDKVFRRVEYKVTVFVILISIMGAFLLIQLYPVAQKFVMEDVFNVEMKKSGDRMFGRGPGPGPIPAPETFFDGAIHEMPDPPMPFFKPLQPHPFPRPLVTEHLFVLSIVFLIVLLIRLLNSRQQMMLEFEKLKSEKLQTSYNALMGQINPHFFFNSLNGLNSLIRNGEKEQTLTYLDELSNVFRYILQSNKKELVTLAEELEFVKAYTYLLSVRYEGKLFFSIQAESSYLLWYVPILSVLPLVENAVKHNVISKQYPLQIDIYTTKDNMLVVSNKIQPKVEESAGSGIGLKNLWGRYKMLTGKDIQITNRKEYFRVSLPLLNTPERL